MFNLTAAELNLRIVGCGDGPASFNAHMFKRGRRVISCDPLYQLTTQQIKDRIAATYETVIEQTRQNQDRFVWTSIKSPDELGQIRLAAMNDFLADYDRGKKEGRYLAAESPYLPFSRSSFDIVLCSHFLFLYSDHLSLAFHQQTVEDMCRVAAEARIFPLLTYNAEPSPFVEPLTERLTKAGYKVGIEQAPYEFQRNGNKMMKVSRRYEP
jgi:hypothetical protein